MRFQIAASSTTDANGETLAIAYGRAASCPFATPSAPVPLTSCTANPGVVPSVNQIEWTPALYDAATVDAHRERGVTLEGYSPFKAADLNDAVLTAIAADHDRTVAQIILRWHLEHGFVAIPKSSDPERIAENFDVFDFSLGDEEVARIDALGR